MRPLPKEQKRGENLRSGDGDNKVIARISVWPWRKWTCWHSLSVTDGALQSTVAETEIPSRSTPSPSLVTSLVFMITFTWPAKDMSSSGSRLWSWTTQSSSSMCCRYSGCDLHRVVVVFRYWYSCSLVNVFRYCSSYTDIHVLLVILTSSDTDIHVLLLTS